MTVMPLRLLVTTKFPSSKFENGGVVKGKIQSWPLDNRIIDGTIYNDIHGLIMRVTSHIAQGSRSSMPYITRHFGSSLASGSILTPKLSKFASEQSYDG
ncbi:hypothetical protein DVH24_040658 [Malus domestica]|uniref:Uncharacterized protein n=1 Tax=Malus domestica TaxID=3750 RepID=A0A498ID55_MALDO|nr:hypothetical protein DVH24_040658 [Malus domestica]